MGVGLPPVVSLGERGLFGQDISFFDIRYLLPETERSVTHRVWLPAGASEADLESKARQTGWKPLPEHQGVGLMVRDFVRPLNPSATLSAYLSGSIVLRGSDRIIPGLWQTRFHPTGFSGPINV